MNNNIKFGKYAGGKELKALYSEIGELWESEADGILEKAAQAYATGGVFDKAIGLFGKLGKKEKVKELQLEQLEQKAVELAMGGKQAAAMELFDVYADEGNPQKALEKVEELFDLADQKQYRFHLKAKMEGHNKKKNPFPYYTRFGVYYGLK